jgi:hypothetical protein
MARDALKALSRKRPTSRELIQNIVDAETDSDRAAALIAASMLEDALADGLLCLMRQGMKKDELSAVFGAMGFLGTFTTKINAGYAFQLFGGKTKLDLEIIKDVRNAFAHGSVPVSFSEECIKEACAQLSVCGRIQDVPRQPWPPTDPRQIFIKSAHYLSLDLMEAGHRMSRGETSALP